MLRTTDEGVKLGKRTAPLVTRLMSAMCLCLGMVIGKLESFGIRTLPLIIQVYTGLGKRSLEYLVVVWYTAKILEVALGRTNTRVQ